MGKAPPLPAPTETDSATELATELSRVTDKTSYSIPEDGSPVTIPTRRRAREGETKLTRAQHQSQTSLLIEYFEGGKAGEKESRRPSVRVKVTPSSKSRSRSANERVQITERSSRKPTYTKRINLSPSSRGDRTLDLEDDHSVSSFNSRTEGSNLTSRSGDQVDIEVMPRRHGSPLIPSEADREKYMQPVGSDISSMPADSFLDGPSSASPRRKTSGSLSKGEALLAGAATGAAAAAAAEHLKTPSRRRSRSLSRERIVAQKAVEKVRSDREKEKHRSRSRSVSNSEKHLEGVRSPRRRSSRSHQEESLLSAGDSSLLSTSQISGSRRSADQSSVRSGASKSSINNPKLLETVEDAIRRLILPELNALKREQSKHASRRERRESFTSGSALSRDSRDSRNDASYLDSTRSSEIEASKTPRVVVQDENEIASPVRSGKEQESRSPGSPRFEHEGSEEIATREGDRRGRGETLAAGVAGAAAGALGAAALRNNKSRDSFDERKERRKRRAKSHGRNESVTENFEDSRHLAAPLPFNSDVNSDLTRTSILSAESDRPHSASEEQLMTAVREVPRGVVSPLSTPSRTPVARVSNESAISQSVETPKRKPIPAREYELDEHGRKVPMHESSSHSLHEEVHEEEPSHHYTEAAEAALAGGAVGAGLAAMHHENQQENTNPYYNYEQQVPPPLRYVPYERRGLSPIQSVSSWREDDREHERDSRLTRSTGSYDSFDRPGDRRSYQTLSSTRDSQYVNKHDFPEVRHGGLADSEISQDAEFWDEQHHDNDRYREESDLSYDNRRDTIATDDSHQSPYLDRVAAGQTVRGVGANPDYVHTPVGVESAVASLVDASVLTAGSGHQDRRGSVASFEEGSERFFTSRGNSPVKAGSPSKFSDEYEIDEHGRKVPMQKHHNASQAAGGALAGAAAGAAAAELAHHHNEHAYEDHHEYDYGEGDEENYEVYSEHGSATPVSRLTPVSHPKSFKERALEGQGQSSPRHSVDRSIGDPASAEELQMTASGLPNVYDPMPEIGYVDDASEVTTNPSILHGESGQRQWSAPMTPPVDTAQSASKHSLQSHHSHLHEAEAIGAGALAGAALANHIHDDAHEDEWHRTSEDRKRDTLVTNPYEDVSPVAQHNLLGDPLKLGGYQHPSSPLGMMKDEGYISSAPNAHSPVVKKARPTVDFLDGLGGGIGGEADALGGGDPFYSSNNMRDYSGLSQGMASPIYDSATGNGIEAIKSKDIIALMDHLTVRDAQRNARDTEILVTLVRAAAEMRNSFEDMKRLLADTEDVIITEVQQNTDRSVAKAINGPRPPPKSFSRASRTESLDEMTDDLPTKKKNVFRRALKGLSMRSSNDLARIEDMLVQLLGEVEGLKMAQRLQNPSQRESFDNLQPEESYEQDRGYEPEGIAGTSTASHPSQSGHFSNPQSRATSVTRTFDNRKFSDHRISTVPEDDEDELESQPETPVNAPYENSERLMTPVRDVRGSSVPLSTPPQQHIATASVSNENTPKTDKSKKHKSSSSSGWIPKISRWSETTASTVAKGLRLSRPSSMRKEEERYSFGGPSRSGSDLAQYEQNNTDPYGEDHLHTGYSQENVEYGQSSPPSPAPTQSPEDPKYKAHRNSVNLQHPQPRPGPTHRYQTALESQAQSYTNPGSPKSMEWGSVTSLNRLQQIPYEESVNSPASDHYPVISPGPERPPKEPIAPEKPPKIRTKLTKASPLGNNPLSPALSPEEEPAFMAAESPQRSISGPYGQVPARKPTGPRSMTSKSGELTRGDAVRRKNRDTFGTIASNHSGESETF